jgi:ATP-binding cassette, subfamily B (MDR/TAP), member 1
MDTVNTFLSVFIIFMSALGTGISMAHAPSISKAKTAAAKVFSIRDEPSKIDSRDPSGIKVIDKGEIEFKRVTFKYPSRVA